MLICLGLMHGVRGWVILTLEVQLPTNAFSARSLSPEAIPADIGVTGKVSVGGGRAGSHRMW